MLERDIFAEIIADHGKPQHAEPVSAEKMDAFRDRLPSGMLEFWRHYGFGAYREGFYWICDPAPFDPILERIFKGDPDFFAKDMTLISYSTYGSANVWNRNGHSMLVDFERSTISSQSAKALLNPETGKLFSKDFLVGWALTANFTDDLEWFEMACERVGRPQRGELFAYAPLLQLGGTEDLDHIRRVEATVHMDILAQLEPFTLIELTDPEPGASLGRLRPVRRIGSAL